MYFHLQVTLPESEWTSEALLVLIIRRIVRIESPFSHHNSHMPEYLEFTAYM